MNENSKLDIVGLKRVQVSCSRGLAHITTRFWPQPYCQWSYNFY